VRLLGKCSNETGPSRFQGKGIIGSHKRIELVGYARRLFLFCF